MSLKRAIEHVLLNLKGISIDEIKMLLEPDIRGMVVKSFVFPPGTFIYRARLLTDSFNKRAVVRRADLTHPPAALARENRANRRGVPVFYGSMGKEAPFFEMPSLGEGDEVLISFWRTTVPLYVNNVGYTQRVFESLGARRPIPIGSAGREPQPVAHVELPHISPSELASVLSADANREVRELLSDHFAAVVADTEPEKYKLTIAIAELHFGEVNNHAFSFGGLLYPSVRMWANADNVALAAWFVDRHLELTKVKHVRITDRSATSISTTTIDHSRRFVGKAQRLVWEGRDMRWQVQPFGSVRAVGTGGKYADGDYELSPTGEVVHWEVFDEATGRRLEPS